MYRSDFAGDDMGMPFVGRENELAHLAGAVELSTTGRTVVVQGAPGTGKTRLARELAGRMTERGIRVLWGHWCEDDVERLPRRFIVLGAESRLGAKGVLFSETIIHSNDLPRLGARLQKWIWSVSSMPPRWRVPSGTMPPDAAKEPCVLPTGTDDRLLLILDDLCIRDRLSLILLRTLARNLRPIPGALLGIFDGRQGFDCADFETALGSLVTRSDRITLRALADHDVARMIQLTAKDRVGPDALSEIQAVSRGNPRTLARIVSLLREHQTDRPDDSLARVPKTDSHSQTVVRFHTAHDISGGEKNLFAREGDYWTVLFRGSVVRLRHVKGFTYIASLMREPYRQLHVLELAALEQRSDRMADNHPEFDYTSSASGLRVSFQRDTGPVLDWRAKEDYARRLRELDEEIREATAFNDLGKIARFQQERAFITEEVARAIGLCGRDRRGASAAERARVSVTHAIKSGIHKIARCQPDLGRHLNIAIRTGLYCSYLPEEVAERSLREQ